MTVTLLPQTTAFLLPQTTVVDVRLDFSFRLSDFDQAVDSSPGLVELLDRAEDPDRADILSSSSTAAEVVIRVEERFGDLDVRLLLLRPPPGVVVDLGDDATLRLSFRTDAWEGVWGAVVVYC